MNGKLETLVPFMEINSFITGKRGVSLPFTDSCPIISPDEGRFTQLFHQIVEHGKQAKWKYIEFRGGQEFFRNEPPSLTYYTHDLDLTKDEEGLLASFRNSTKRNIKRAVRERVKVQISHSLDSVRHFFFLNCKTRKRHGLPPQPFRFFKKLHEHVISKEQGFVCLAQYEGKAIAGVIFLVFGKKAIYKYGASDMKYQHLRANNLVMWEAIKECINKGRETLNLGRTEPQNEGLLQFKRGWNPEERSMKYHRYDLRNQAFIKDTGNPRESYNFLRRMPLWLLNLTGTLLYKHVG
ncbi:MAG: peptidoglycan bridge formation glycyltransferase FemA/FemB family protein [Deltaproteobacteria bacterium]|nr:peptidoglycan bridge formation glycyltransferase FemA/FemB family protein [Deltaproteobacteria bacterium]